MSKFKIYLAGGMSGLSWEEQTAWRKEVIELFQQAADNIIFVNPCDYYNFKEKTYDCELEIMNFDLHHVSSSDLVFVYFNSPKSIGTAIELGRAYDRDIPTIGVYDKDAVIHPWLFCCCDKLFEDFDSAVDYIITYYIKCHKG